METCTVETGLLRRKPCGNPAATHCANCEQPLCTRHAIAQLSAGRKTGKFLCADCHATDRQYQETAPLPLQAAKAPAPPRPAAPAKPAAPAQPAAPAAAPAAAQPPQEPSDGSIDFTPAKK